MGQLHAMAVAGVGSRSQAQPLARGDVDPAVPEHAQTELRPLKIGQRRQRPADLGLGVADRGQGVGVVLCVPWLKLRRKTSTPLRDSSSTMAGARLAGPRVATMRVRRSRIMGRALLHTARRANPVSIDPRGYCRIAARAASSFVAAASRAAAVRLM